MLCLAGAFANQDCAHCVYTSMPPVGAGHRGSGWTATRSRSRSRSPRGRGAEVKLFGACFSSTPDKPVSPMAQIQNPQATDPKTKNPNPKPGVSRSSRRSSRSRHGGGAGCYSGSKLLDCL